MPAPPAWLLQEPPNSIERLDRIITPSATISP
ncbi:lysis system o-spanin lipoprotein Rz1 [Pseudomonas aeruginosa]